MVPMPLASALLILLLAAGCRGRRAEVIYPPQGIPIADSASTKERRWREWRLEPAWSLGGQSDRDTALLDPYLYAAAGDRLIVVEGDQRLHCFGPDGVERWQFGSLGSGPKEFRQVRDVKVGPRGRIYVNDPGNRRVTILTSEGKLERVIPIRDAPHSERIVPLPDPGRMILIPLPAMSPKDVVTIDATGATIAVDSLPWPAYRELNDFSRLQVAAADALGSARWVMGLVQGNGWFVFDSGGPRSGRRFFIEPTEFAAFLQETFSDGSFGRKMIWTEPAAQGIWLVGDTVFVRFGGKGPRAGHQLDLYSWESGNYLFSVPLPDETAPVALAPGWLYLAGSEPAPWIRAYRRSELPDSLRQAATAAPQEPQYRPPVSSGLPQVAQRATSRSMRPQLEQ